MTQETKFGLLIGGTFIFCFALILSNAKDPNLIDDQVSALLSSKTTPAAELTAAAAVEPIWRQPAVQPFDFVQDPQTRSQQPLDRSMWAAAAGARRSEPPISPPGQTVIATTAPMADTHGRQSPPSLNPPSITQVTDAISNRPRSGSRMLPAADSEIDPSQPRPRQTPEPRLTVVYVTAKNDNLTRIARKFYERSTPADIERIYRANATVLKSRNSIPVGAKLEIPLDDRAGGGPTPPIAGPIRGAAGVADGRDARWYEVQKDDGYCKIARDQLGDEQRWKELFELNKPLFPDPDCIRPGVRIRLPQ